MELLRKIFGTIKKNSASIAIILTIIGGIFILGIYFGKDKHDKEKLSLEDENKKLNLKVTNQKKRIDCLIQDSLLLERCLGKKNNTDTTNKNSNEQSISTLSKQKKKKTIPKQSKEKSEIQYALKKDVVDLYFEEIKKQKYKIALTTSSDLKTTKMLLKRIKKLNSYIDVIVTRENYKKSKPNPEPYLVTAKNLKLNLQNVL